MPFPNKETQFKKGQSGNPKGRPKKPLPVLEELLAKILNDEQNGLSALEAMLMTLRAKAVKGDIKAVELFLDRGYGKAKQSFEMTQETELRVIMPDFPPRSSENIDDNND
jgi:hypothetical protein